MKTGMDREENLKRIAYAESLGFEKCEPYAIIGIKKPRWYWNGSYYNFSELPLAGGEWPPISKN